MFNPFSFLKQQVTPTYLGIDIGTTSIKVVEVIEGTAKPKITNYGLLEAGGYLSHANKALQTSTLKLFDQEVIELLRALIKTIKPQTNEVVASFPAFGAFMTIIDLPDMSPAETKKAMDFQAPQYIPLPISEVGYDYLKVGEFDDEQGFRHQQVLLFSITKENMSKYQRIFKAAGLRLEALEIESFSLARILMNNDGTPTLIVDIGSRATNIVFVDKGQLKFSVQSDFAGASLTQALATSLNINPLRAEELKKQHGITLDPANYELSTVMLPILDGIINEVKKGLFTYAQQFPKAPPVERMMISGGSANLHGIEPYFQTQFEFPIMKAAPFLHFEYPSTIEPLVPELNPVFSVALGLGAREFI